MRHKSARHSDARLPSANVRRIIGCRHSPRCETFGPLGPWLVTKDEIKSPQSLHMWLNVNGEQRQRGTTKNMIFDCRHLVWYCSQFFVLEPGDVIITGTPAGVGLGIKLEPKYLKPGDVVTLGIDGLGEQRQKVVKFKP